MTNEQKVALQRIKDPAFLNCEGTDDEKELLQFLLEGVANSKWGSKVVANLKQQKDLPKGHRVTIKIQDTQLVGLPPASAVHQGDGTIILFKDGKSEYDKETIQDWIHSLAHELYHEEQFQQGLGGFKNFTPEQNFIINRLNELDALTHGEGTADYIKEGFEGLNGGTFYANIYNRQALNSSINMIHSDDVSSKSFEEVRNSLVKRLGIDIDPEYFSIQTLENSECGKVYFKNGKLPIQAETREMSGGKLFTYKHPKMYIRIYIPDGEGIEVEEQTYNGGKSTLFTPKKSSKAILAIEQTGNEIESVQTQNNPSSCGDIRDFRQVVSYMNLPKDVQEAFDFNPKKIEKFVISPPKKETLMEYLERCSTQEEKTNSKQKQQVNLNRISSPRGG